MTCRKDPVIEVVLAKIFVGSILALGFSWVCGSFCVSSSYSTSLKPRGCLVVSKALWKPVQKRCAVIIISLNNPILHIFGGFL